MSQRYTIAASTLRGIADSIRQKLRITDPVSGARLAEYVAAFPTREVLDIQRDANGVTLLVQEGLATLIPPDGDRFSEISWRVIVNGEQVYSDGDFGSCGAVTSFDLLSRYEPRGGEEVKIRAMYSIRHMNTTPVTWTDAGIDSAPVTLGWTLHEINNQTLTVTKNGTYTPDEGYTGFGSVTVKVAGGEQQETAAEKKYIFADRYIDPFTGGSEFVESYTINAGVGDCAAGDELYVEVDGVPYGSFVLDAEMLEQMNSSYCDVEVLPDLHYGVDFDAQLTSGWFWTGAGGVQISMYCIKKPSATVTGGACMHTVDGYTVFLDGSGIVHLSSEQGDVAFSWTVEILDAESGSLIERGSTAMGDTRYVTELNASGKRAYAKVFFGGNVLQTNTGYFP